MRHITASPNVSTKVPTHSLKPLKQALLVGLLASTSSVALGAPGYELRWPVSAPAGPSAGTGGSDLGGGPGGAGGEPSAETFSISLTAQLPLAKVGEPYLFDLNTIASITGPGAGDAPPIEWSNASPLPGWATLSPNGLLSGTPSETVAVQVELVALSGEVEARKVYSLVADPLPDEMILVVDTALESDQAFVLPLFGTVDVTINWGSEAANSVCPTRVTSPGHVICNYPVGGKYTIRIGGTLTGYGDYSEDYEDWWDSAPKLVEVRSFGNLGLQSLFGAFSGATNLTYVPAILPATVTNLGATFADAYSLNHPNLNYWDVKNVTSLHATFNFASSFNQPLYSWDVSNVRDMSGMFGFTPFNHPIGHWDVSNVTDMGGMFFVATSFNQPLAGWNVSSVVSMTSMFSQAYEFNQPLNDWDVSSVGNMNYMFSQASRFNQPLDKWNVSNVHSMEGMFSEAPEFNQPLNDWDVSSVTTMARMFSSASSFNQPLDQWDVSIVKNMSYMFSRANSFNQPLDSWDVSRVELMTGMFSHNSAFNLPLAAWDVSGATNMLFMFDNATRFNQNLSCWNVEHLPSQAGFASSSPLLGSPANLPRWGLPPNTGC